MVAMGYDPVTAMNHHETNIISSIRVRFGDDLGCTNDQELLDAYDQWKSARETDWDTYLDYLFGDD